MKSLMKFCAALLLAVAFAAKADAPDAPMPMPSMPAAPGAPAAAPSSAVPAASFPASRYEVLWTKSPFAVATSETVGEESPDYFLVGIANFDGVSYASVIEAKPPQEHFLISTDKPVRGMTLKSINHSQDGTETYAVVVKDGQSLTLKLQQAPAIAANDTAGAPPMNGPANFTPQIPMPGAINSFPNNPSVRPFTRFHRPPIHLPPMTQPQIPPSPASGVPQPPVPQPVPPPPQ